MALSKYVVQAPGDSNIKSYLDQEFRKIQRALDSLVDSVTKPTLVTPTLNSPWVAASGAFGGAPAFSKDAANVVHLRGGVVAATPYTFGSAIFTLPVGYRPQNFLNIMGFCQGTVGGFSVGRIVISNTTGAVSWNGIIVSQNTWDEDRSGLPNIASGFIGFDNIHFKVDT